jgi:hypothetical protein
MKVWKHIVFVAGIAAAFGFFVPLIEVQHKKIAVSLSARELSFGLEKTHKILDNKLLDRDLPKILEKRIPTDLREDRDDARLVAGISRYAALIYVPALLMVVVGLFGILKRRFGRVLGSLALVLGIASIGAWIGLRYGIAYGLEEADIPSLSIAMRFGAHMILLGGIVAVLSGLGALVKPEHPVPRPVPAQP